jgi:hypothetical protein
MIESSNPTRPKVMFNTVRNAFEELSSEFVPGTHTHAHGQPEADAPSSGHLP